MPAGAKPFMSADLKVLWERETTFGVAPAAASWRSFGTRMGDVRSMGPFNKWQVERGWAGGRQGLFLNRVAVDYGGALGEFKLTDAKVPAFAWGEELSAPAQIGATAYYRHTATPTTNNPQDTLALQVHAVDAAASATRTTYLAGAMEQVEIAGNTGGETSFTPTFMFQDEDSAVAEKTVVAPANTVYRHFHSAITLYGVQQVRVDNWRFRMLNTMERARYHNATSPLLAYEYPFEDVSYAVLLRLAADKTTFGGFSNRDWQQLAENGDIGTGILKGIITADQEEFQVNIGSGNDALAVVSAQMVGPAGGGKVAWDLELIGRVTTYQWVDTNSARFFSA